MSRILEALRRIESRGDGTAGTTPPCAGPPPECQIVLPPEETQPLAQDAQTEPRPDPRFAQLADRILRAFPAGRRAVLMVTSPGAAEGKTAVAASLAGAIASRISGQVLALDGDPRHPELAVRLGGGCGGRSAVCPTPWKRLDVLPGIKTAGGPPAAVRRDLDRAIEELSYEYQVVLVDGPSLAQPEALWMAPCCDGVLLVVRLGSTGRRAARRAVGVLQREGATVLGCVVTNA